MQTNEQENKGPNGQEEELGKDSPIDMTPVLEEIVIEELAVDGICGIY
jgi:mycofactocin precursor